MIIKRVKLVFAFRPALPASSFFLLHFGLLFNKNKNSHDSILPDPAAWRNRWFNKTRGQRVFSVIASTLFSLSISSPRLISTIVCCSTLLRCETWFLLLQLQQHHHHHHQHQDWIWFKSRGNIITTSPSPSPENKKCTTRKLNRKKENRKDVMWVCIVSCPKINWTIKIPNLFDQVESIFFFVLFYFFGNSHALDKRHVVEMRVDYFEDDMCDVCD